MNDFKSFKEFKAKLENDPVIQNDFKSDPVAAADQLFISEHTVKTHRKNIFKKLQINHVSQLTSLGH